MSQSWTVEKPQQAFTFFFRDPAWKNKLLIGSALVFAGWIVPLVPLLFVYGYGLRLLRGRVVEPRSPSLPEWDNWGELLVDGLKLAGVSLIYLLPGMAVLMAGYGLMMAPSLIVPFLETSAESGITLVFGMMGIGWLLVAASLIVSLAGTVLLPPAIAHMAAAGRFGAAFRVREWWRILRANLGGFAVAYLIVLGAGVVLGFALNLLYLTLVLCCLIPFLMAPAAVYMMVVAFALFGDAYRVGADQAAAPAGGPQD